MIALMHPMEIFQIFDPRLLQQLDLLMLKINLSMHLADMYTI